MNVRDSIEWEYKRTRKSAQDYGLDDELEKLDEKYKIVVDEIEEQSRNPFGPNFGSKLNDFIFEVQEIKKRVKELE